MANYVGGKNIGREIRASDRRCVYRMTGRSPSSRDRIITQEHSENYDFEFWVRSKTPIPPEKAGTPFGADVMEYMCLAKLNTDGDAGDILLLGNGIQTADIAKDIRKIIDNAETKREIEDIDYRYILKENLLNHGVEPDNVTPRTACVIKKPKESPVFKEAYFGTVFPSPKGEVRKKGTVPGEAQIMAGLLYPEVNSLATYKGETAGLEPSTFVATSEPLPIGKIAPGQHLAEVEYKELQEKYWVEEEKEGRIDTAVATVAVVLLGPDRFSLGLCKRHNVA